MKKGWQKYIMITVLLVLLSFFFLLGISQLAICVTDSLNEKYLTAFKEKVPDVSAPWYENGYHIVDEGFVEQLDKIDEDHKNVVVIGSSMSLISFKKDEVQLPEGYDIAFLVCGNGSLKSNGQLYDMYRLRKGNDQDVIKLEISFSSFRYAGTTITESVIDKWGRYKVTEEGHVTENSPLLAPVYYINKQLLRIQNMWELGCSAYEQLMAKSEDDIVPGNFRNYYHDYEQVVDNLMLYDDKKKAVTDCIDMISGERRLIVEFTPMPPSLAATDNGKAFCEYLDKELIPYLEEHNISYFDNRFLYSDEHFCDGLHMDYETGREYTRCESEALTAFIENK